MQAQPGEAGWFSGISRWFGRSAGQSSCEAAGSGTSDYQGGLIVRTGSISAVSIANIADVQSHQVFRAIGTTSHVVRFIGGGELRYACDDSGQVIAMSATGVHSEVSDQHVVMVAALNGR